MSSTILCASLLYLGGTVNTVALPTGESVHAGMHNSTPAVCVQAASDTRPLPDRLMFPRPDLLPRRYIIVPTGYDVPDTYAFAGAFTYTDGFIWTVFEVQ